MIKTPLKKVQRNASTAILYMVLMAFSYLLLNILLLSDLRFERELVVATHFLFIGSSIFFLFSWLRNPGYIKKDPNLNFYEMIEKFDANHLCPECQVIRSERSRHCNICN